MILALVIIITLLLLGYWLLLSPKSQLFGRFPYQVNTSKKLLALTFDDGPNEPYTSQILDYLDQKQVKATFFVVGRNAECHPDIVKKAAQNGHEIGNHSLAHQFRKYFTQPRYRDELTATQQILTHILGTAPTLFRPPWLYRTPFILGSARNLKLTPISGRFCDPLEVFQRSGAGIAKHAIAQIKPGAIIIFHDGYNAKGSDRSQTVIAVKAFVDAAHEQGYRLVTVSTLLTEANTR